jgi:hypothetical protein
VRVRNVKNQLPKEGVGPGKPLARIAGRIVPEKGLVHETGAGVRGFQGRQACGDLLYISRSKGARDDPEWPRLVLGNQFPEIEARKAPDNPAYPEQSIYATMRNVAQTLLGTSNTTGVPLLLICDHCGNVLQRQPRMSQRPFGK